MFKRAQFYIYFIAGNLLGCFHHDPLSVLLVDKTNPPSLNKNYYIVKQGDTLSQVAQQYNQNLHDLAAFNNLEKPFYLYQGDTLYFPISTFNNTKAITNQTKPIINQIRHHKFHSIKWIWPVKGSVITRFNQGKVINNGIDIAAKPGSKITAAASGEVVYSGDKLKNYGNLLVIKHPNNYLTAYAHNKYLYVKKGDSIQQGQVIAEIGNSGTDKVKLHFQMRYKGKPINPIHYLS